MYNAAIYIILRDKLVKTMQFTSPDEAFYIMDEKSSIDIDTHLEFKFAEAVFLED